MEEIRAAVQQKSEKVTAQQIADNVVEMIQKKVFRPGEPIREAELCKAFHVSRTPVREALRLLQNNGVVKYIPHCGVQVVDMTEKELHYITDTRIALEVLSTREAALCVTPEQIAELRQINDTFLKEQDTYYDAEFHMAIARVSGNFCLLDFLHNLYIRQAIVPSTIPMQPQRFPCAHAEHEAIVQALELHDQELAAKQADIHFHISQANLQTKLRKYLETKQQK